MASNRICGTQETFQKKPLSKPLHGCCERVYSSELFSQEFSQFFWRSIEVNFDRASFLLTGSQTLCRDPLDQATPSEDCAVRKSGEYSIILKKISPPRNFRDASASGGKKIPLI